MVVQGSWAGRESGFFWTDYRGSKDSRRLAEQQVISHSTFPMEKRSVKKFWVRKLLGVIWSSLLPRWKFSPKFPGTQFSGFCSDSPSDILELTALWSSLIHHHHFPDVLNIFLTVNWNWCGSYTGSWRERDFYSILVSLVSPTTWSPGITHSNMVSHQFSFLSKHWTS